jgi:protein-S-isoprenylcysteine O-methyltransferase
MLHTIMLGVLYLFPLSEVLLALQKRAHSSGARSEDGGSVLMLWVVFGAAIAAAVYTSNSSIVLLPLSRSVRELFAVLAMGSGILLRWSAIHTLGRFFTVDVAIHPEQTVVQNGLYRWVRHPSYTGLLLIFLGMGLFFGNFLSLLVLFVPASFALWARRVCLAIT